VLQDKRELQENLQLSRKEITLFRKLLEAIYQKLDIEKVLDILAERIQKTLHFSTVLISVYNEKEKVFERKAQAGISLKTFEELRNQKVPFQKVNIMFAPQFQKGNSFYIPHSQFETNKELRKYIEKYGKRINRKQESTKGKWHPNDVFLTPIKTRNGKLLGMVSVDNPSGQKLPTKKTVSLMDTFSAYASIVIENNRVLKEERNTVQKLNSIHNISRTIGQIFDLKTLYKETIHIIRDNFGYSNISIFEINEKGNPILRAYSGYKDVNIRKIARNLKNTALAGKVLDTFEALLIPNVQQEPSYVGDKSIPKSEAIIPLIVKNEIIGILDVEMNGKFSLTSEDLYTLTLLGEYIAMSIDNARLYRQARRLAIKDEMTGTFNYRYFREVLNKEIKQLEKTRESFSLLMIDIDSFKLLNDTYGHLRGDKVLKKVSRIIKKNVRTKDIVTRYGGDEFVIVLWGVGKNAAKMLGERIRKSVKKELNQFSFPLTLSVGVSTYPDDGKKVGILLDKVDKALYRAKTGGRDRTSI